MPWWGGVIVSRAVLKGVSDVSSSPREFCALFVKKREDPGGGRKGAYSRERGCGFASLVQ